MIEVAEILTWAEKNHNTYLTLHQMGKQYNYRTENFESLK